ncbi:MAG: hypothetical protein ABI891_11210 [Acidobacteriota bacterium]
MNKLLKIVLVVLILKASVVFLLFVGALTAWMNGGGSVLLPGLGLIISIDFIVIALLMTEILLIAIAAIVWRQLSKTRLL